MIESQPTPKEKSGIGSWFKSGDGDITLGGNPP